MNELGQTEGQILLRVIEKQRERISGRRAWVQCSHTQCGGRILVQHKACDRDAQMREDQHVWFEFVEELADSGMARGLVVFVLLGNSSEKLPNKGCEGGSVVSGLRINDQPWPYASPFWFCPRASRSERQGRMS